MTKTQNGSVPAWLPDELQIFGNLETIAQIGWCMADHTDQVLWFSDYMTGVLRRKENLYEFAEFIQDIHPEYRHRLTEGIKVWEHGEVYDQVYPVRIGSDYVWFHAKFSVPQTDARGHSISYGTLQILEPKDYEQYTNEAYKMQMADLLQSQKEISDLLLKLLQESNIDKIISEILASIIKKFDADRSYIFSFNHQKQTHSCVYEVTQAGVTAEIDDLQDFPISGTQWWCDEVMAHRTIILEDIHTIEYDHPVEFEVLDSQDIESVMVVPLISGKGVWGYMGVDIVGHQRTWNQSEQEWFEAISNYISVCLELHRAVTKVQRGSETMRSIYRNLPIGVEVYNANGELEDINDVELAIFNAKDRSKVLGRSIFKHPILSSLQVRALRRGKEFTEDISHTFNDETRAFYGNRTEGHRDLSVKCTILYGADHMVDRYLMMVIDNTVLLDAFKKMHESETLFDSISEFAEVGFYRLNVGKQEFFATNQWYKNMLLPQPKPGEPAKKMERLLEIMHPDDKSVFSESLEKLKARKSTYFKQEIRVKNGDDWKWLRSTNMISEDDPKTGRFVISGLNDNITEAKQAEQKLLEAIARAEESDRLKSAFLANMSHEIRTPLNAIVGFSSILADTDDPDERTQFLAIIERNNEQLLQLIADILDLSKIEAGVIDVTYGEMEVNSLCATVVNSVEMKVKEGVTMSFESHDGELPLYTDRSRLTQVLTNYLGNAAKFTDSGSIKLSYVLDDNDIEFSVQDTGIGMKPEEARTVFDRFVKLNNFASGTGLGLSICKSIAEKLGGSVGVDSVPGQGSRFWIRLPYIASADGTKANTPISAEAQQKPDRPRRKTVLIAEDNDSNALLMFKALEVEYTLLRAHNGIEAVEMYQEHQPDLILMDVKMPDMDGIEATELIREIDRDIPIIAISDFTADSDNQEVLNKGCNEYLAKPVIGEILRKVLKRYI